MCLWRCASLVQENPTVDEVIHLPAGVTYWQTGSFRMYHHNPPLVKLIAALPVLSASPVINYSRDYWKQDPPNKAQFAHEFMAENARHYFELFTRARLLMPLFSVIGGIVVFLWSRKLYGDSGGLFSLALWVFCPNILAHARLVTTDVGATSLGVLATFVFWSYLKAPSWRLAAWAGVCLGLAQLTKFSPLVLYGLWPALALVRFASHAPFRLKAPRTVAQGALMVALSLFVIDLGYGFEGVGVPLGQYEFTCQTLTRPVAGAAARQAEPNPQINPAFLYRVNRFRGTALGALPMPLPRHYLLGFDDQKLEAEGIPRKWVKDVPPGPQAEEILGYPVYLDGQLRQESWWYYYLATLVYKVPEGTWLLVVGSFVVLAVSRRSSAEGFDELAVLAVPAFVLLFMSVLTNINLGLRYVLPIFPYVYISAGKLARWASQRSGPGARRAAWGLVGLGLTATIAATASIHPHYLAYFNAVSGGPDRGAEHLIDSNLDWGQDLVGLRRWLKSHAPGERMGLAYFGQIHPRIFEERGDGFDWFLPPPERSAESELPPRYSLNPDAMALEPGLYAVSASLVKGLPWRVYDSPWNGLDQNRWAPRQCWTNAFGYFRDLTPIDKVGHSIWIYRVSSEQAAALGHYWKGPAPSP